MKITFFDVGQGDSIVFESEDLSKYYLGIIDCNLTQTGGNPVLDLIIAKGIKQIDYVFMSHPHTDHYSGFPQLFQYCLDQDIVIKNFIHTCTSVPEFLQMANKSKNASTKIQSLFKLVRECYHKFSMNFGTMSPGISDKIDLQNGYELKMLAPTQKHIDNYTGKVEYEHDYEVDGNSIYANWLSTVIQITHNDSFVLLTSDAPKAVLKELGIKKYTIYFSGKVLFLGQSSHHGAKANHSRPFWKQMTRKDDAAIVFSVGDNHYGHPAKEVVDSFIQLNYEIYSTNEIGGVASISKTAIHNRNLLAAINVAGKVSKPSGKLSGNQEFYFK